MRSRGSYTDGKVVSDLELEMEIQADSQEEEEHGRGWVRDKNKLGTSVGEKRMTWNRKSKMDEKF